MRRRAFTLVELLVVIGIIGVLVAILLPVISRAKESAMRLSCVSNLHALAQAFMGYATANEGQFPFGAGVDEPTPRNEDWIWWQPGRDLGKSAIAPYLGTVKPATFRCPSDPTVSMRERVLGVPYQYSYSMNMMLSSLYYPSVRLSNLRNSTGIMLLVDEDEVSADDGNFAPGLVGSNLENFLSIVHDRHRTSAKGPVLIAEQLTWRGNVAFADGHVDLVERKFTHDPKHYDPAVQ